jgi:recombination protein RecR
MLCRQCCYLSEAELCVFCADEKRDQSQICIVEEVADVTILEGSGVYRGVYHVLHGHLSPLRGITPDDLRIAELMRRLQSPHRAVNEVIVATNPNVDGDAMALYLQRLIEPLGIRVTRLAQGLPIGGSVEYADELTIRKALESRKEL